MEKELQVKEGSEASLRAFLKEGAIRRAQRDLRWAEESFILDEKFWQRGRH